MSVATRVAEPWRAHLGISITSLDAQGVRVDCGHLVGGVSARTNASPQLRNSNHDQYTVRCIGHCCIYMYILMRGCSALLRRTRTLEAPRLLDVWPLLTLTARSPPACGLQARAPNPAGTKNGQQHFSTLHVLLRSRRGLLQRRRLGTRPNLVQQLLTGVRLGSGNKRTEKNLKVMPTSFLPVSG